MENTKLRDPFTEAVIELINPRAREVLEFYLTHRMLHLYPGLLKTEIA